MTCDVGRKSYRVRDDVRVFAVLRFEVEHQMCAIRNIQHRGVLEELVGTVQTESLCQRDDGRFREEQDAQTCGE